MVAYLAFGISDERAQLVDAMCYSVAAGGKRIRPLLTLATYSLFSDDVAPVMALATAIELLHTYSLIHDDLPSMDNDILRRGLPTCHVKYGEDIAILAGDTLNTFTFELLATELPRFFSSDRAIRVIKEFARACGIHGMSGGQLLDLKGATLDNDPDYLLTTHALKTGALLSASITLPALLVEVKAPELELFRSFGNTVGQLFQIVDDLLDVTATTQSLGKTANKDIAQNKLTYIKVFGIDRTKALITDYLEDAHRILDRIDRPNIGVLHSMVDYIGGRHS